MSFTLENGSYFVIRHCSRELVRALSRNERDSLIPSFLATATGRSRNMSRAFTKLSAASICQPQQIHQLLETRVLGN